jgi:hypothetical protein
MCHSAASVMAFGCKIGCPGRPSRAYIFLKQQEKVMRYESVWQLFFSPNKERTVLVELDLVK